MTLFVDTYTRLLCHMGLVNIALESYMRVLQKMLKSSTIYGLICKYCNGCKKSTSIYETYMRVLQISNGLTTISIKRMWV
jgi:hypothetical protein